MTIDNSNYYGFKVLSAKRKYVKEIEFACFTDAVGYYNQHINSAFSTWMELIGFSKHAGCVRLRFCEPLTAWLATERGE